MRHQIVKMWIQIRLSQSMIVFLQKQSVRHVLIYEQLMAQHKTWLSSLNF